MKVQHSAIDRRRFLCGMIAGGAAALGAGAAAPLTSYVANLRREPPPPRLELDMAKFDVPPGGWRLLRYGPIPALLFRTPKPEGKLKVFVATCTHFDCTVSYRPEENRIYCACHEGYYDTDGHVISGPPPRPLRPFFTKLEDGKLIIALQEENLSPEEEKSDRG